MGKINHRHLQWRRLTELFKTHYESSSYYDPNIGSEFDQAFDEALGYVLDALDEKCRKEC